LKLEVGFLADVPDFEEAIGLNTSMRYCGGLLQVMRRREERSVERREESGERVAGRRSRAK
jgi:hypothetical protein